jgi:hypothetical protein
MLKVKLVAFLFCLTSTIANAEPFKINRTVLCEKANIVLNSLEKEFREKPVWQGKNNQELNTLLVVNTKTESWTIVITDGEHACVIDSGKSYSNPNARPTPPPQVEKSKEPKKLTDI